MLQMDNWICHRTGNAQHYEVYFNTRCWYCFQVLAQQRAEQTRLAADQNRESNDAPLDPASFIQSLPSSLRQQVLSDMDDSMVAVLPSDLAAEANVLRREVEERHRRLVQERLFAQGAGLLSGILRHSGITSIVMKHFSALMISDALQNQQ